jgi:hypothetical protein
MRHSDIYEVSADQSTKACFTFDCSKISKTIIFMKISLYLHDAAHTKMNAVATLRYQRTIKKQRIDKDWNETDQTDIIYANKNKTSEKTFIKAVLISFKCFHVT